MKTLSRPCYLPSAWFAGYVIVIALITGYVVALLAHDVTPVLASWIPIVLSVAVGGMMRWWGVVITWIPGISAPTLRRPAC